MNRDRIQPADRSEPDSSRTPEPTLAMLHVRLLIRALEQAGVPSEPFLGVSLYEAALSGPAEAPISRAELSRLCIRAAQHIGDPALGLHWIGESAVRTAAPGTQLLVHASCLRHAFESLCQFQRLFGDEPMFQLLEDDRVMAVRALPVAGESLPVRRFWAESRMVGIMRLIRDCDPNAQPIRVSFDYAAPAYAREYEHFFGSGVRFVQPHTEIVIDRALLSAPMLDHDAEIYQISRGMAERRLMRLTQMAAPNVTRVREFVQQHPAPYRVDMQTLSRALGLSVRSLRRHLASEGQSYRSIMNDTLANMAKSLLADTRQTLQEVAYALGFDHMTAFHDAFKRWTAMTPTAYRQELLRRTPRKTND